MSTDALRRPPSNDGLGVGSLLALVVHAGLVAALAWGVHWKRSEVATVSAELWASVPQLADAPAPKAETSAVPAVAPPPAVKPPPPRAEPVPETKPETKAAVKPPVKTDQPDADIATEQRKKKEKEREAAKARDKEAEAAKAAEQEKQDAARKAAKDKARKEAAEQEADKKRQAKKEAAEREAAEKAEAAKDAAARKAADAKAAKDAKAEAERTQRLRQDQLNRMNSQLGGTGTGQGAGAGGGNAARTAAPSAGYAGRIRARVLPNIVFNSDVSGNPTTEVEVRMGGDGRIMGVRILRSSGVPGWDQAVLRALERTEEFPADIDGRLPPVMVLTFDPNRR